ncbi:MAG: hypothetical protein L6V95_12370 [Candidatus Melainabacteria bacterium]|nr:MAG: hypothetical protein L6V95_12370 [Candidatus Melainabacteria bacterium]
MKYHYNELKKLNPKLNDEGVIEKGTKVILPKIKPEDEIHLAKDIKLGVGKYQSNDDVKLTPGLIELRDKITNKKNIFSRWQLYNDRPFNSIIRQFSSCKFDSFA